MSRHSVIVWALAVASTLVVACGGSTTKWNGKMVDSADSLSYIVGTNIAYNILQMDSTMRAEGVMAGIEDALKVPRRVALRRVATTCLAI